MQQLGAGTATTLWLSEPWHGSGGIACGDSWFASLKTAVRLRQRGVFFIGNCEENIHQVSTEGN